MSEFQFVEVLPGAPYKTVKSPNRKIRPDTQVLIDYAEALRSRPRGPIRQRLPAWLERIVVVCAC